MTPRLPSVLLAGALCAASLPPARAAAAPKDRCDMKAVEAAKKGVAGLGALDQRKVKKYFKHDEKRGYFVHPESEVCDKPVIAFVHEAAKAVPSAGWDTMSLEKQAEQLERVNGWYKTLEERAAALKKPAEKVIGYGVGIGLIKDAGGERMTAEETVALQQEEYEGGSDMLARDVQKLYAEIPATDGDAGRPGEALAAYLKVRDALADHLAEVGSYTGFKASALSGGKAVDFTLYERMDQDAAVEPKELVKAADAARRGFVDFVRSGKAMEGNKLCDGPCDTVAEWVKALEGDAKATRGTRARQDQEAKGEAEGAKERGEKAGRAAANTAAALFPEELKGKVTPEEHDRLVNLGWNYEKNGEDGALDPHYLKDHPVHGAVVLHPSLKGNHSYCAKGVGGMPGTCFQENPFKDEAFSAPGGATPDAASKGPAKDPAPADKKEAKKDRAEPSAADDAELKAAREANVLTLYADSDCRNDGTGAEYRFCPWVKAAFQKLSAERGAKTRFRFLFSDAGKDAEWRALYDSLNIDPPALVYREHGQIKAMRAPHFPDAATTEARITDFVSKLDTGGGYEPGIPGRRVKPRVEPPAPCVGRACGRAASVPAPCGRGVPCGQSASSDDGPPPDVKYGGAFGRGRSRNAAPRACRPGQPCFQVGEPDATEQRSAPPVRSAAPRAVQVAAPSSGGARCVFWTKSGCPACVYFKQNYPSLLESKCPGAEIRSSGSPGGYPYLSIDGQGHSWPSLIQALQAL